MPFTEGPTTSPTSNGFSYDVAIVGGGFSGVVTAVQLLRNCPTLSIALIERGERLGRGLAFGTSTAQHLLNVPAGKMSAFPDEPASFHTWLKDNKNRQASAMDFVSRQWYGEYVAALLEDQLRQSDQALFRAVRGEAIAIRPQAEGLGIDLEDASHVLARRLVLAVGNFPPSDPSPFGEAENPRYARYAWSDDALEGIQDADSVLIIGSGLTGIDQVVTLIGRGFNGTIHMISRRGLLPAFHQQHPTWQTEWTADLPASTRRLVSIVREQVRLARNAESDWRPVIDSLRPATQRIWKSLSTSERKRFLRHVRSFWEVHRHRVAPEIGRLIWQLQQNGRLILRAGKVVACVDRGDCAEVSYRERRKTEINVLRVARIINCTGHETDARKIESPVLSSLLDKGLARVDASHLGLDIADDGALIDGNGQPSRCIFALGSARKGMLWESTAVPEIRVQARDLAKRIVAELARQPRTLQAVV